MIRSLTRRNLLAAGGLLAASQSEARTTAWTGFTELGRRSWRLAPGATLSEWRLERTGPHGNIVTLVWVTAAPPLRAGLTYVERRDPALALYRSVPLPGVVAAINGSFFEGRPGAGERPMGLLRQDGATRQGPTPGRSGGFLTITDGRVQIRDRRHVAEAAASRWAIESSPILVQDGDSGMRRDDHVRADRVAAGVTTAGVLCLAGAFAQGQATVSLFEFEQLCRQAARSTGDSVTDLIAMDGGPSAHLWLPTLGRLYGSRASIYLTNLVTLGV